MIADILFLTNDKAIGTFSNVLVSSPNLYTSCNKLSSSNDLIKYLDSTPEYCLDYFLFNKQDNEGMFNGKNVVALS